MRSKHFNEKKLQKLVAEITQTFEGDCGINFIDAACLPVRGKILTILDLLFEVLFPGHAGKRTVTKTNVQYILGDVLCQIYADLTEQTERAYRYHCRLNECQDCDCATMAANVTHDLLFKLPEIRESLKADVEAAFLGDPAARSYEEIVISYPCIGAIATYRIAHVLYDRGVPLIPRIMSECAHARTGIDIHPGATIGKSFFIDHGTGVVIGETTVIGNHVKLYQGTTLGALSFRRDKEGRIIKGDKRHPTIEDDVTIYAEATILGDVTIGKGSVVGGNVWIKESVPPNVTVTASHQDLVFTKRSVAKSSV
ncbi:serine O-acetyltransferase EpsC [Planctomycetota bacterium]